MQVERDPVQIETGGIPTVWTLDNYVRIITTCFSSKELFLPNPYLDNQNTKLVQRYMRFNFQV